jgi:hypothetical protein
VFDGTLYEIEWRPDRDEAIRRWPPQLAALLLALAWVYLLVGLLLPDVVALPLDRF